MAAPAQPKKIVAPTVSQINAEFVTQVSLAESGVCVEGGGGGGGIFFGTGSTQEAFVRQFIRSGLLTEYLLYVGHCVRCRGYQ